MPFYGQTFNDWLSSLLDERMPEPDQVMWIYQQSTGKILDPSGMVMGFGYSGKGKHKNNPESQSLANLGPIPEGYYTIGAPHDTLTHGPFVLPLTPDPQNIMFGRSHFLIHGDSVVQAGTASEGCIILNRHLREDIARSPIKLLTVVAGVFTIKRDVPADEATT